MDDVLKKFQDTVQSYYAENSRDTLPWRQFDGRGRLDPYHVFVSEVMLQQTQVSRVVPKFVDFISLFPGLQVLAKAELKDVLTAWSGLGYNRRAKYLHDAARIVVNEYGGTLPREVNDLMTLPGIGRNTAAAIAAYSFNSPTVFIETNIRTVFIHHFFPKVDSVGDNQILPLVQKTLDTDEPRLWYWALMDYGSYLKRAHQNPSRKSRYHTKQSTFSGSKRQIRGQVLRLLISSPLSSVELSKQIQDNRLGGVLIDLVSEGLVRRTGNTYHLGK